MGLRSRSGVGQRWRHRLKVAQHLIGRWRREYLTSLRAWRKVDRPGRVPTPGDIVLVQEGLRRITWHLARVEEVLPSRRDGHVRLVVISLKGKKTRRASALLCPLETESPWV